MKGLIKKDLLLIKGNLKTLLIIFFIFTVLAYQNETDLSFIPGFISMTMFMATFSYDEYNKWDAYAISLPNGKKNVVASKYIATLILIMITILITIGLSFLIGYFKHQLDIEEILSMMCGTGFAVVILQAIIYPVIFKFGIEKSRIALFVFIFILVGLLGIFLPQIDFTISSSFISFLKKYLYILLPIIMIIVLFISYKISEHIYQKKEF